MPAEASRINGITDAMLAGKPVAAEVLPDFLSFIGNSVLVAHNAPFDISFMNEELSGLCCRRFQTAWWTPHSRKDVFPGLPATHSRISQNTSE